MLLSFPRHVQTILEHVQYSQTMEGGGAESGLHSEGSYNLRCGAFPPRTHTVLIQLLYH